MRKILPVLFPVLSAFSLYSYDSIGVILAEGEYREYYYVFAFAGEYIDHRLHDVYFRDRYTTDDLSLEEVIGIQFNDIDSASGRVRADVYMLDGSYPSVEIPLTYKGSDLYLGFDGIDNGEIDFEEMDMYRLDELRSIYFLFWRADKLIGDDPGWYNDVPQPDEWADDTWFEYEGYGGEYAIDESSSVSFYDPEPVNLSGEKQASIRKYMEYYSSEILSRLNELMKIEEKSVLLDEISQFVDWIMVIKENTRDFSREDLTSILYWHPEFYIDIPEMAEIQTGLTDLYAARIYGDYYDMELDAAYSELVTAMTDLVPMR